MDKRTAAVLFGIITILSVTFLVIAYAVGLRPNWEERKIDSTGILVATSDPVGAQVFIDEKLKTATNTTINLTPGKYKIKIAKDGYFDWQKDIEIKKEEVYTTNAFLFPKAPDLRPLTLNGAINPTLSPDETKIAYLVASASATANGLWTITLSGRPIIGGGDVRQIFRDNGLSLSEAKKIIWSTDGTQLIASTAGRVYYRLEAEILNANPDIISATQLEVLNKQWLKEASISANLDISRLPYPLPAGKIKFSPDGTRVLYTATQSAVIPPVLTTYIPGSDPTPEIRKLKKDCVYIYDVKEDRNYEIANCKLKIENLKWFPTSRHLVYFDKNQIGVIEYDGTNQAVVYTGPFVDSYIYVWPNWSKIVILTSLNQPSPSGENLYTINLR